jgi:membrane dipeptidase
MTQLAAEFHQTTTIMDCHQEILDEYVYEFLANEEAATKGEKCIFNEVYLPVFKKQGADFVNLSVGGDHVAQVMYSASEFRFWDAHKKLDILNSELEAGCQSFIICRTAQDIDLAIKENKVGILTTISGGRPLMGKPNLNLLSSLRSLYRMGLRGLQLTGNGRNRLGDGVAQNRSRGQLTTFGEKVVKEADRLGMVIDTAQLSDAGFYDLISITKNPIIDSHSCAQAVCPHPRNIDDQRIKAIADRGGVIAVSFWASLVNQEKEVPDGKDLIRHIDHIVDLVGIDHVALGPDYCAYQTPVDRDILKGFANLGPDYGEFDRLTPVQSEKYPGYVEGIWYGIRKSDFISGPETHESFPEITQLLLKHGISETECQKILGSNMLNVYREILD